VAVVAFERAADRYSEKIKIASDALFKAAGASYKQAKTSEYDQSVADQAISSYKDFISLYPEDMRATNAQSIIGSLRAEQARGNFRIAQFYEKNKKWDGALIYYNEVLLRDAGSPLAAQARQHIESLKSRTLTAKGATAAPSETK
jgi:outer membrane protein assembly factor BamD (BamD/ComL family)